MAEIFDPNAEDTKQKSAIENFKNGIHDEESRVKEDIPNGYISIELSTHGLVGAPARFHTRNFDTSDLMNLALSEDEELPEKVAKMLDNLILEKDVSVMNFHEQEVIEYLVRLYQAYYSTVLKEVDFPWGDADIEYLKTQLGTGSEFETQVADLRAGRWAPKTDVDLALVETYDIDKASFKKEVYIKEKKTDFQAGFSFPRYGDIVILRNFMLKEFRERDKQFAMVKETLKFRRDAEDRMRRGEEVAFSRLPSIPEAEKEKFRDYEVEKSLFGVMAIKALHLVYFDGQDLRDTPLKDRMALAQDPRLDYKMMKTVNDYFDKLNIGLKKEVKMRNPFTQKFESRRYSFRLVDLLQAIKLYESDEYDINFEPSHQ
jgi:hypothetical protein